MPKILIEKERLRKLAEEGIGLYSDAQKEDASVEDISDRLITFASNFQHFFAGHNGLPLIEESLALSENPPKLRPELITGILRAGHKMTFPAQARRERLSP